MATQVPESTLKTTDKKTGCYLYAIIDQPSIPDFGPVGIDVKPVYCIGDGHFTAVLSDIPNERLRPERRKLAAHHEVLKRLLQADCTVLPMSFGLVAENAKEISRILSTNREAIGEQTNRLQGKVEMGLHVLWDVPNIFEFFVNNQLILRQFRDQIFRGGREPTQDDKIELGRLFDRLLFEERTRVTDQVVDTLRPYCFEFKENKPRNEKEVVNLAFLVDRKSQKNFEQGIFMTANQFDHHYAFDFNGPWPAHNFVDLAIELKTKF